MHDIAIVGAGFWGTCTAIMAREKSLDTIVIDDNDQRSGSRNAAGMIQPSTWTRQMFKKSLPEGWTIQDMHWGLKWLSEHVPVKMTGDILLFHYGKLASRPPKHRPKEMFLIDSPKVLLEKAEPVIHERIYSIRHSLDHWEINHEHHAKHVVLACGYRTDEILVKAGLPMMGVFATPGTALVFSDGKDHKIPESHLVRPHTSYTIRPWGDSHRFGEWSGNEQPDIQAHNLLNQLKRLVQNPAISSLIYGNRPTSPIGKFIVKEWAPKLIIMSGGYKYGLGVAPFAAKKALEILKL